MTNLYGPTEAAIDVSYFDCSPDRGLTTIPIGKPIANIQLHILDTGGNTQPIGVPGELHIAGEGLARAYPAVLSRSTAHPIIVLALVGLTGLGTWQVLQGMDSELLPQVHQGEFSLSFETGFFMVFVIEDNKQQINGSACYLNFIGCFNMG